MKSSERKWSQGTRETFSSISMLTNISSVIPVSFLMWPCVADGTLTCKNYLSAAFCVSVGSTFRIRKNKNKNTYSTSRATDVVIFDTLHWSTISIRQKLEVCLFDYYLACAESCLVVHICFSQDTAFTVPKLLTVFVAPVCNNV